MTRNKTIELAFQLNANSSIEFAVHGNICIGRILCEYIGESEQTILTKSDFQPMMATRALLNILDFSLVDNINNGAWGYFLSLFTAVARHGGRLRVCGLRGSVLTGFNNTKTDGMLPRYATVEDAIAGVKNLNAPETENWQTTQIARLVQDQKLGAANDRE